MQDLLTPAGLLTAFPFLIMALNQLLKSVGLSERFVPVANVVFGFIAYPLFSALGLSVYFSVMGCLILGLSAGGFYDFGKKTLLNQ